MNQLRLVAIGSHDRASGREQRSARLRCSFRLAMIKAWRAPLASWLLSGSSGQRFAAFSPGPSTRSEPDKEHGDTIPAGPGATHKAEFALVEDCMHLPPSIFGHVSRWPQRQARLLLLSLSVTPE